MDVGGPWKGFELGDPGKDKEQIGVGGMVSKVMEEESNEEAIMVNSEMQILAMSLPEIVTIGTGVEKIIKRDSSAWWTRGERKEEEKGKKRKSSWGEVIGYS